MKQKYTVVSASQTSQTSQTPHSTTCLSGNTIQAPIPRVHPALEIDFSIIIDSSAFSGTDGVPQSTEELQEFLEGIKVPDWTTQEMVENALKETYPERYL